MKTTVVRKDTVIADPPFARFLFSDTRMAPVWLIVRLYVGFSWLDAGWHKVIAFGEVAVGLGLIFGAFVGIAAVSGAFMNLNYMLAGSVSSNPVLLILGFLLVLAWKTAGFIGFDRYLLPLVGTPWKGVKLPTAKPVRQVATPATL